MMWEDRLEKEKRIAPIDWLIFLIQMMSRNYLLWYLIILILLLKHFSSLDYGNLCMVRI